MSLFLFLDYAGTLVFAISGALAAMNHRFDPFGVVILALVTAIGGGTLRDVMIGNTPVGWMIHVEYLLIITLGAMIAMIFRDKINYLRKTIFLFDAIGLSIFTITGVEIGLDAQLHPIVCVILGTLSAAFGGVVRDILINEVPLIFHKEIYASLSLFGGLAFLILVKLGTPNVISVPLISALIVFFRVMAVRNNWVLPKWYTG